MRRSKKSLLGVRGLLRIAAGVLVLFGAAGSVFLYVVAKDLPTLEQITNHSLSQTTKLYDRTGNVLLYEISGDRERTVAPIEKLPTCLKDATVAVEDEKFYMGPAFDWKAIVRALIANLKHGRVVQGGSTITQQLAKNAFLTPEQTITRKIKEILLAQKLAAYYSKDQILGLYLNEIPYGPTIYGAGTASEAYFGKPVWELPLAQCALLAAIPKAPSYYSPWGTHVEELLRRREFVLRKMRVLDKITQQELDEALTFPIVFSPQKKNKIIAPHFVMEVQEYLTQKYGEDLVRRGGLRVITTLDVELQKVAEEAVAAGAARNTELYGGTNAALVAEDPKTGDILALVGSKDYFDIAHEGNFNVATQGLRQPGSALKPFVYLTAFEKGYTPDTVVFDVPTEFVPQNPSCPAAPDFTAETKKCFHPENFDERFRGPVSLRRALAQSINIPAVKVLYLTGIDNVIRSAPRFGITTLREPSAYGLSLVLGGGAVKLAELVGAYAVLAADGVRYRQSFVLTVQDAAGRTLESRNTAGERVAPEQAVRLVNNILSDVDARRGLFQASIDLTAFPGYDVALKTGTSNDYRDAWSIGYTPALAVGVWAGNNDNSPMHRKGSSILAAVPIWHDFMKGVIARTAPETFTRPDPPPSQKPILRGEYLVYKQLHSILYYVNKDDPDGPPPSRPIRDPQFANWEYGVLQWGGENLSDFSEYNVLGAAPATTNLLSPLITIQAPLPGARVAQDISVSARLRAESPLIKTRVTWNGILLEEVVFPPGQSDYAISKNYLLPSPAKPQNLLEVYVLSAVGLEATSSVVVYAAR